MSQVRILDYDLMSSLCSDHSDTLLWSVLYDFSRSSPASMIVFDSWFAVVVNLVAFVIGIGAICSCLSLEGFVAFASGYCLCDGTYAGFTNQIFP